MYNSYDRVSFYSGPTTSSSYLGYSYYSASSYTAYGRVLLVRFYTDSSGTDRGFYGYYSCACLFFFFPVYGAVRPTPYWGESLVDGLVFPSGDFASLS